MSCFSWANKKDGDHTAQDAPMGLVLEMSPKDGKNFNLVKSRETFCISQEEAFKTVT